MALVFDLIPTRDLLDFARNEAAEVNRNQFTLSRFLPDQRLEDTEFSVLLNNLQDVDAAQFRSYDTESPIGARKGVTRMRGQLPPISRKIPLMEENRLRLRAAESGNAGPLLNQLYDDVGNMVRSVLARLELAKGEALYTGKLTISENGVIATVDFGRAAGHTVTAGTPWSTVASATPLADLTAWRDTYVATNGARPGRILVSTATLGYLVRNAEIRALAATVAGTPTIVTENTVNQVFNAYGLPPIEVFDEKVRVNGTQTPVIPANRVVFLPEANEPLGNTFYGVTAEALDLQAQGQLVANDQAGLVATISRSDDPVQTWTKAVAIALPVLVNANLTFSATVAA